MLTRSMCVAIMAAWFATGGAAALLVAGVTPAWAQGAPPALRGTVTSDREGPMEGVLVSARRQGSTDHRDGGQQRQGRIRIPGGPAGAGLAPSRHPGRGLCARRRRRDRDWRRRQRHGGPQAQARAGHAGPMDQRRIAGQRARPRGAEAQAAQLHRLPFAAADFRVQAHRRRIPPGVRPHGRLLSRRVGHAAAAAGRQRQAPAGQSGDGAAVRRLSRSAQSQQQGNPRLRPEAERRARPAAPPASSSPNTICRGKKSSLTT